MNIFNIDSCRPDRRKRPADCEQQQQTIRTPDRLRGDLKQVRKHQENLRTNKDTLVYDTLEPGTRIQMFPGGCLTSCHTLKMFCIINSFLIKNINYAFCHLFTSEIRQILVVLLYVHFVFYLFFYPPFKSVTFRSLENKSLHINH